MVTQIVEFVQDVPMSRRAVWEVLTDSATYPRLLRGVGQCEYLEGDGPGQPALLRVRIGNPRIGIRCLEVRLIIRTRHDTFELYCAELGSFATIRLRAREEHTRVNITVFAPGRVHPMVAASPNAAVLGWLEAGMRAVVDRATGSSVSMLPHDAGAGIRRPAGVARQLLAAGVVQPQRPARSAKQLAALARWSIGLAGGYAAAAASEPERLAVIDDQHTLTFAQMHRRTAALAAGLSSLGLNSGDSVGILARNHTGMVETMVAAGKLGIDLVLLNAGLSGRQLEEIAQRERLAALFVDEALDELVHYLHPGICRYLIDSRAIPGRIGIEDLITLSARRPPRSARPGRLIVLTSGTSGTPKGARRPSPGGLGPVAAMLSRIPMRMGETMLIASPLFHTWGLGMLQLSTAVRATVVLQQRFDAEACLRAVAENRVSTLILVPTMVERILDLPAEVRARYDTSCLRIVASAGAPMSPRTVLRFMDVFGDVLYNVYGSTEVSWATIATPQELREAPATVGRPPAGTRIAILDPDLRPVPVGATGRVFIGNEMLFDGYVNSAPPAEAHNMLDTGDMGYVDVEGRLFIDGRGDEMIIAGGEKFFPRPVEEALEYLPQVREAAVVGVPDADFGQRLAAFIVKIEDTGLDSQMIRDYLRHRLGRVAVPRDVSFLPALPRGETGKILKRLLIAPDLGAEAS